MEDIVLSVRNYLEKIAEGEYKKFTAKLIPTVDNILGIRLPVLRNISKEIVKADYNCYLNFEEYIYFEEIMLKGMIIGELKIPFEQRKQLIKEFLPKINNWSVCDSFCAGLKFVKKEKQKMWKFINEYITSDKPFDVRFVVVTMLDYYIDEEYIDNVLQKLAQIKHNDYYVKMAMGWALSVCYIKFPQKTVPCFKNNIFTTDVHNIAIKKICESLRVSKEQKAFVIKMKIY